MVDDALSIPALLSEASKSEAPPLEELESSAFCSGDKKAFGGIGGVVEALWAFAMISARFLEDIRACKSGG